MSPRRKERAENVSKNILAALAQPKPRNPAQVLAEVLGLSASAEPAGKFDKRPTARRMHGHRNTRRTGWCGRRNYRTV